MTYSTTEVRKIADVTFRQITWWRRSGWIPGQPKAIGSGAILIWTQTDLDRVIEIRDAIAEARSVLDRAGLTDYGTPNLFHRQVVER